MSISKGEIVPLFKTPDELNRDQAEIEKQYLAAWESAYVKYDGAQAVLKKSDSGVDSLAALVRELRDVVERRNDKMFGIDAVAKRSFRFATAARRPYYGAAATLLQHPAVKQ